MMLRSWLKQNEPDDNLRYKSGFWDQIRWVRDVFVPKLAEDYSHETYVSSTHRSKSVLLPVYYVTINGNSFEFRYNFHDWCITGMTELKNEIPAYFKAYEAEGFYEGMTTASAKFKICVQSREQLYAIMLWVVREGYK